jgi:intracellular multiplication protein IcmV
MPVKDIFKVTRKTFVNPAEWFGFGIFINQLNTTWEMVKGLFTAQRPARVETFAEAVKRLRLTEQDLAATYRNYLIFTGVFLLLGFATIGFGVYLLLAHTVFGAILSLPTAGLFFVNAFRYHFWAFQIKHRKLGCTFAEWRAGKVLPSRAKKSPGSKNNSAGRPR